MTESSSNSVPAARTQEDHERGLQAARAWAQWKLGDRGWADELLNAYWNPSDSGSRLAKEKAKYA